MIDFKKKMEEELEQNIPSVPKKKKTKVKVFGFIFAFLMFFFVTVLISGDASESWAGKIPFLGKLVGLMESSDKKIRGEEQDRINILLLGMGEKKHEGGYLTDTIILASLQPSTKKIALLSIPRDMVVPIEGFGWNKINAINAFAENKKKNSGGEATSQALSDILDIPIHYYFRIDFEGFVNIIDHLGGLNIEVENTLSDYRYPILGRENYEDYYARFEHLYIEKGWQKMNGDLALKYVRSRHALGVEGSDFARARRQQKVIQATKDKLLKSENLLKPMMISSIITELNEHVSFNMKIGEALKLWQIFKDVNDSDISNYNLDDGPQGLLVAGRSEAGAYILSPRKGDFSEIRQLVNTFFTEDEEEKSVSQEFFTEESFDLNEELAKLEIKNGTWINGLVNRTADQLKVNNFEIIRTGNAGQRDFLITHIYDFSYGGKKKALQYLKDKLEAEVYFDLPLWLAEEIKNESSLDQEEVPDFLIILGENANKIKF